MPVGGAREAFVRLFGGMPAPLNLPLNTERLVGADHETLIRGEKSKPETRIGNRLERELKVGQMVTAEIERYRMENRASSISTP